MSAPWGGLARATPLSFGRPIVMTWIGDSIVAGFSPQLAPLLPDAVMTLSNGRYVRPVDKTLTTSVAGYNTDDLFNSAKTSILLNAVATNPDVFIYQIGTNSVDLPTWTSANQDEFKRETRAALGLLALTGKPVIVLSILPKGGSGNSDANGNVATANTIRRQIANELGMLYVDIAAAWGGVYSGFVETTTYTHPNAVGTYKAAVPILSALDSLFPGRTGPALRGGASFSNLGTAGARGVIIRDAYTTATWSDSPNTGGSNTKSITTDSAVNGNVLQSVATMTSAGNTNTTHQLCIVNTGSGFAVGDVVAFTCKVRVFAASGTPALIVRSSMSGVAAYTHIDQINPDTWAEASGDTGWIDICYLIKIPTSTTQARIQMLLAQAAGGSGAFGATVQVAEACMWNLTTMKMATRFGAVS